MHAASKPGNPAKPDLNLQACVDALARGECTEDEFLARTLSRAGAGAGSGSAWNLLSVVDQRYRRGQLSDDLFHSLKSRIAQQALSDRPEGVTVELSPAGIAEDDAAVFDDIHTDILVPAGRRKPTAHPPRTGDAPLPTALARGRDAVLHHASDRPAQLPGRLPMPVDAAAPAIPLGRILRNRYVIESLLGRGGMGDVFKASDGLGALRAESPSHVAVKVLRSRIDDRPELAARLLREFDCTRRLSHPHVVRVYEFDRTEDCAFYTMELLNGENVADLLKREKARPLPVSYAWAIIGAVGAALAHAHARSVTHGDVSPKNVMITSGGQVRVLDFGSSTVLPADGSPTEPGGAIAATPAYASCELLEGQQAEPRDDLYALACLAYELLTGEHPFQGKRATEARDLGMVPRRPADISHARWRALQRGLSWTRAERSIPVRQWLAELGLEPDPEWLPPLTTGEATAPRTRPFVSRLDLSHLNLSRLDLPWLTLPGANLARLLRGLTLPQRAAAVSGITLIALFALWSIGHPSALPRSAARATVAQSRALADKPTAPPRDVPPPATAAPSGATSGVSATPATAVSPASTVPTPAASATAVRASRETPAGRGREHRPPVAVSAVPVASTLSRRSPLRFTVARYDADPGAKFIETRVWRARKSTDTRNFVWWTTESSAKAGTDFVPQTPTPYIFSRGRQLASLFVKLLPNPGRNRDADFQVCVGKPGTGESLTDVTCSAILVRAAAHRAS